MRAWMTLPSSRRAEEEDTDVTEIIGGDIENEEES